MGKQTSTKPVAGTLKINLVSDTGLSSSDLVTSNGTTLATPASSTDVLGYRMSADGGVTWSAWTKTTGSIPAPGADGNWIVQVRETTAAGKLQATTSLTFKLDTAALSPTLTLINDTGTVGDSITRDGSVHAAGLETGARLEYSHDGGSTWQSTFAAQEGLNNVLARQVDVAGNVSVASALQFTLDTGAPVVGDDAATTDQDKAVNIAVLANDSDAHVLALSTLGAPAHGSVAANVDGSVTYTPDAGYAGTDSFVYNVVDVAGNSAQGSVSVTINAPAPAPAPNPTNTAPEVWQPLNVWTTTTQSVTADALQNAWDPNGDAIQVVGLPASLPAGVSFDAATQSFTFDPTAYASSTIVTVNYGVSDGMTATPTSVTFVSGSSHFTPLDPTAVGNPSILTNALLAPNSGIAVDAGSIVWHASGAASTNLYDGQLAALGIGPGLLLTSGATPAPMNTVAWFGTDNTNWNDPNGFNNGDTTLDAVVNTVFQTVSYDATTLSFSFEVTDPTATSVSFDLVFGSDEFPEWVDQFVDCAIVVVNGVNVALFNHDAMHPLSVIGSNLAGNYFIDNGDGHLPIEYDGVSARMKIVAPVQAGTNTIKIGIGDTGDHVYDSGVFLANFSAGNLPGTGGMLIEDSSGTAASDLIQLTSGSNTVNAGAGDDIVIGNDGNNTIAGGSGSDDLVGGAGADEFDYKDAHDWAVDGMDTIADFSGNTVALTNASNTDTINGDVLLFSYLVLAGFAGASLAGFTHPDAGHFSTLAAGELSARVDGQADAAHAQFVYDSATGVVGFDPDGTGALGALDVTLIGTRPASMSPADFVIEG